jgi:glycoside/pentoside/hexuronide:cation symporter, GPH family
MTLRARHFITYALLALPLAFLGLPLYLNIPKFYLEQYGINLATLGAVLLALRIGDAFLDPLIGKLSDQFAHARRSIFIWAAIGCAVFFNALFLPPLFSPIIWFAIFTGLTYFSYSVLTINYYSAGLQQADEYAQRTTLSAYREGGVLIGTLLASLLPQLLQHFYPALQSFQIYGGVFSILLMIGIWALLPTLRVTRAVPLPAAPSFIHSLKENVSISWLFGLFFCNALPTAITSTLFLFYVQDVLHAKDSAGYFLGVYFLAAVLSAPCWTWIAGRIGKRISLLAAMALAMGSFIWAYFLGSNDAHAFYMICVVSGFAIGADMIVLPALLADVLPDTQGGAGFGVWHALSKWSLALAAGIALPALAALGYDPAATDQHTAAATVAMAYAIIPCALKAVAFSVLLFSPLDRRVR